ncbi:MULTISPECIES: hypothetical protein [Arthrobacter]|uniref:Sigma-70, region 4 n=2 Tax=Arthrobacter TaxID=1663 RepID=A0ABU9KHR0_9MICC|nr:hypothetical protein [Arthrobacter sp. YJM1]MDP5226545.1 hypothetical protein [Arthrobacter sp. YJM1]
MESVDFLWLERQAVQLGETSERLRQAQLRAARMRQEAMFSLHVLGLSVRGIAARLGVSAAVVQASLKAARDRRPRLRDRHERVPYELHIALLQKLDQDEAAVREIGRGGVENLRSRVRGSLAEGWVDQWVALLDGPLAELEEAMLEDSEVGMELRQLSPFAGALSEQERIIALKKAAALAT